jgi:hypothetical protein
MILEALLSRDRERVSQLVLAHCERALGALEPVEG